MADWYAWSPIVGGKKKIEVGDKVTQDDVGSSDDEWAYFKDAGVIRTQEYPVPAGVNKSPKQHLLDEAAKLDDAQYAPPVDDEVEEVKPPAK